MISFTTYRLTNGLRLLHYSDKNTQMVALNVLYDVGSKDENPKATGLAHLSLYTSDAADDLLCVDLGGRRIIKKKKKKKKNKDPF